MPRTNLTPLTAYRSSGVIQQKPLLATKLYIPQTPPNRVSRPRLTHLLNEGLNGKLILIAAPPGFGKTTLVSDWIEQLQVPVGWVSLDAEDNDPARFLTYCVAALQTLAPDLGEPTLTLLDSPQPPSGEAILTTLLNEVMDIPTHFVLVLDDYHVITSERVHEGVAFFIDHLPPQMRMVIISALIRRCLCRVCAFDGSLPNCEQLICASRRMNPQHFSTRSSACNYPPRMWNGWQRAPKDGSPGCNLPGCRCKGGTTPTAL